MPATDATSTADPSATDHPKRKCSFCGKIPKLRVTPGDPHDPIGICIECALAAVKVLVTGAVEMLAQMQRDDELRARAGIGLIKES